MISAQKRQGAALAPAVNPHPSIYPIKIIIASSHLTYRKQLTRSLRKLATTEVPTAANKASELYTAMLQHRPDLVLFDLNSPIQESGRVLRDMPKTWAGVKLMAISDIARTDWSAFLRSQGFHGLMSQSLEPTDLEEALHGIMCHGYHFPLEQPARPARQGNDRFRVNRKEPVELLNSRELEILRLLCLECTNEEIAEAMVLSNRTIEGYKMKIKRKLGVKTFTGAIAYAVRNRLVNWEEHYQH